jgi:predicted RNA binding protein YcfA (HicA-like mRNA interferase family)
LLFRHALITKTFYLLKRYILKGGEEVKFKIVIKEDLEDGGYNVSCPALSGCHSQGKLPVISGLKAVKAFSKAGWVSSRQTRNHVIMEKVGYSTTLSVPKHRELKRGTLRDLIKDAGLTVEEFVGLL